MSWNNPHHKNDAISYFEFLKISHKCYFGLPMKVAKDSNSLVERFNNWEYDANCLRRFVAVMTSGCCSWRTSAASWIMARAASDLRIKKYLQLNKS